MRIGLVGCGLIGNKRAHIVPEGHIQIVADADQEKAANLGKKLGALYTNDWRKVVEKDLDLIIVATPHHILSQVALEMVRTKKHVLLEKPGARFPEELNPIIKTAKENNVLVHVGFNHRYHPALRKAKELVDAGELGELMFIRGHYGHGGRLDYNKEWRFDPEISGGGELIDQGTHLVDLARWFLGEFTKVEGLAANYFWGGKVEDNGFLLLCTEDGKIAALHVSWTEWKNSFSFEIFGKKGKIKIEGLGGSYGTERITFFRMLPLMGPPETTAWEFPGQDVSWQTEFQSFLQSIKNNSQQYLGPTLEDAKSVLSIIQSIRRKSGYDHCA